MTEQDIQLFILTALYEKKEDSTRSIEPIFTDIGAEKETFASVVEQLERNAFIEDAKVQRGGKDNQAQFIFLNTARITNAGIKFLKEHI